MSGTEEVVKEGPKELPVLKAQVLTPWRGVCPSSEQANGERRPRAIVLSLNFPFLGGPGRYKMNRRSVMESPEDGYLARSTCRQGFWVS